MASYGDLFYSAWLLMFVRVVCCDHEILLSQVVFRHGDRMPINSFTNDPYKNAWHQNLGQLSSIGMMQAYSLGRVLQNKYVPKLLNASYNSDEVSVLSSDTDRTLSSAYCVLAGLYPPDGTQSWNPNISWQPIPVRSIPSAEDNMLQMSASCPKASRLFAELNNSFSMQQLAEDNQEFLAYLSQANVTGQEINFDNIVVIFDNLYCQNAHNMTWPSWAKSEWNNESVTVYEKIVSLFLQVKFIKTHDVDYVRLMIGSLLKELVENMEKKVAGQITEKLFLFSAHDVTLEMFLALLGLYPNIVQPYTAAVFLELCQTNGTHHVSLAYRNTTSGNTLIDLPIPLCPSPCSLSTFIDVTRQLYPQDWKSECYPSLVTQLTESVIGLTATLITVIIALVIVAGVVCWYNRQPSDAYSDIYDE